MKVILQGYNTCCQNRYGGVQNRIRKMYNLLLTCGLEVEIFNSFSTQLSDETLLHVFMLNFENYQLIKCAKEQGAKVVISSIVNLRDSKKIDFCRRFLNKLPILTTYKMHSMMLEMADLVITETKKEKEFLTRHYKIPDEKIIRIPNGIDPETKAENEIYDKIGKRCRYALVVGRFDKNKNQLSVIKALKGTNIEVVFVGGPDFSDDSYYKLCVDETEGETNFCFLGWLDKDSPILASAYKNADMVIVPSYDETFGFTILEGAISGAKLAVSNSLPILEYGALSGCATFDPSDIDDIRQVVEDTYFQEKDNNLKNEVEKSFSWNTIINEHIIQYEKLYEKEVTNDSI